MKATIFRKEHFNSAHRLHNKDWSEDKNREIFGKCNNPNFHGHNYDLVVELTGEIEPETGYVFDMKKLSALIQEFVLERFDHKNLNEDLPEFKILNPTAENIAMVIWKILRQKIHTDLDLTITLYETERNYVRFPASK